ncbi:uncharacterized protein F4822DRAFT_441025 [Hypoxylon trugodes]|uniref:uncharacterized protein n=1 Tax=Hypoxylon trugodes TaxID=326681 RepID=UPI00219E162B|nr:uncharacterized protein F4822DRAFT_441025 [Hypoxylon trugodes]KAI1382589.1 hypothetical protein F4822DRAFT_441025 [Hypoxylon trugodes]
MAAAKPAKVTRRSSQKKNQENPQLTRQLTAMQREKKKLEKELADVRSKLEKLPKKANEEVKANLESQIQQIQSDLMDLDEPERSTLTPVQENEVVSTDTTPSDPGQGDILNEGLFVSLNKRDEGDECETLTLDDLMEDPDKDTQGNGKRDETPIGWAKGSFGRPYIVCQLGPSSLGNFRIRKANEVITSITGDSTKNLRASKMDELKKEDGDWVLGQGGLVGIQGVAWHYSDEENKFELLQKPRGITLIKVKVCIEEDGVTKNTNCWVTKTAMRRFRKGSLKLQEDIMVGDKVIISKDKKIMQADLIIIRAAIRFDKKYQEYIRAGRTGGYDRSPSPDPDATN